MPPRREYGAPWGRSIKVITPLTVGLILLAAAGLITAAVLDPRTPRWAPVLGLTTLGAVLTVPLLFLVRGYRLDGADELVILRPFHATRISLAGLQAAERCPGAFTGLTVRAGNGGMGGFIGWFWNRSLGGYRAWVTDPRRSVLLKFPDRRVVLSPDDPDAFIAALAWLRGLNRGH